MGPDEFSDPIVIPITITIPNPACRRPSGPFGRGRTRPPGFLNHDLSDRQRGVERPRYTPAQLAMPIPIPPPVVLPGSPDEVAAALKELRAHWARARRRAQHVEGEIGHGDYGSAAGHLLLGSPYPAEVDSGFILNSESTGRPDLDALIDETEKDWKSG